MVAVVDAQAGVASQAPVAPWTAGHRRVLRFAQARRGYNALMVRPPGNPKARFRVSANRAGEPGSSPYRPMEPALCRYVVDL